MRQSTILPSALLLVLAAAAPAVAHGVEERPFRGAVHGYGMVEPDAACPPVDLRSVFTTTGHVSDLGAIELDYFHY